MSARFRYLLGVAEALIERSREGTVILADLGLVEGQTVRIVSGPFVGLMGTLHRLNDAGAVATTWG